MKALPKRGMGARSPDLERWEAYLMTRSPSTRRVYATALRTFCKFSGYKTLREAALKGNGAAVMRFLMSLKQEGHAPETIHTYLRAIKAFYRLVRRPLDPDDLRLFVPRRRVVRSTEAIPPDVVFKLTIVAPRIYGLLFHFLFGTGVRISEACALRVKDLDLDADPPRVIVSSAKTYDRRVVFIPSDLAAKLREHVKGLPPDAYVFHSRRSPHRPLGQRRIRRVLLRALQKIGELRRDPSGKGYTYTLHSFRRTFETLLVSANINPLIVKTFMGHSIGVEAHYLRLSESELVNAWKRAEPLLQLNARTYPTNWDREAQEFILFEALVARFLEKMMLRNLNNVIEEGDEERRRLIEKGLEQIRKRIELFRRMMDPRTAFDFDRLSHADVEEIAKYFTKTQT